MLRSLASLLALCVVAHGLDMSSLQPYETHAEIMFLVEDGDSDGVMTVAEIEAVFTRYDANSNNMVSRHEYTTFICASDPTLYQLSHYLFDEYDVDGDHHLIITDYDAFHAKMDTDNNGLVEKSEFITYWVALFNRLESVGNHAHGQSHEHGASACH